MEEDQRADGGEQLKDSTAEAFREVIESMQGGARESTLPEHLRHLSERERAQELDLKRSFAELEHDLRKQYATWIIKILAAQLFVADAVFVAYAWAGEGWHLTPSVIEVWLAATVVRTIGVVFVVTRHLFPSRDGEAGIKKSPPREEMRGSG